MEPRTLHEQGSTSPANRLNDFASHILEGHSHGQGHDDSQNVDNENDAHAQELSFTGAGGILESSGHGFDVEDAVRQAMERHQHEHGHGHGQGYEAHIDPRIQEEQELALAHARGQEMDHPAPVNMELHQPPADNETEAVQAIPPTKGRKRKGTEVRAAEVAQHKKDSHKEVERKRRTNINDGIDQLVAQMAIPGYEKAGKGVQLRKAVEYMAELGERVMAAEKDMAELRKEKQDLEANLALTSARYTEEHERCTSYERMWREAQDREAKSQFDIAQLLDEMAQLRRRAGETE